MNRFVSSTFPPATVPPREGEQLAGWHYVPGLTSPAPTVAASSAPGGPAIVEQGVDDCKEQSEPKVTDAATKEQLAALTHLPTGMMVPRNRVAVSRRGRAAERDGKAKGKKDAMVTSAARNARINKVYNPQAGRPMPSLRSPLQEYQVTLERSVALFTTSTSTPAYGSAFIALSQYGATDLLAVFDQYRIVEAECWIDPDQVMAPASREFFTAIDLDDANVPAGVAEVWNHASCVNSMSGTSHYHRWVPYMAVAAFSGAFTSYVSSPPMWIDAASPGVQHYGVKAAMPYADGVSRVYWITTRVTVAFRGAEI